MTSGPRGPLVTTWGRDDAFWGSARRNARSPGEDYRRGSRKELTPERILEGLQLTIPHAVCPEGRRTAARIPPGQSFATNRKNGRKMKQTNPKTLPKTVTKQPKQGSLKARGLSWRAPETLKIPIQEEIALQGRLDKFPLPQSRPRARGLSYY